MAQSSGMQTLVPSFLSIRRCLAALVAAALATGAAAESANACPPWQASWIASPQPTWDSSFVLPLGMPATLRDATLRQSMRLSLGGDRLAVVFSNEYGRAPLRIGGAAARLEQGGPVVLLLFAGASGAVVRPGERLVSDPAVLPTRDGDRVQVDLYLPEATALAGFHWDARDVARVLPGDATWQAAPSAGEPASTRAFVTEVRVASGRRPAAVVALGDSLTDGNGATPGADQRWPDHLARRLAPHGVAVLNAGISGNRLLRGGMGESALARFERDVLRHCGVRAVVVLLGTNDIGWPQGPFAPKEPEPTLEQLAAGFRQLAAQARSHGVRVMAATLPPLRDALQGTPLEGHYSPRKEALRRALNTWIRTTDTFDAVVDVDAVLRDPADPGRLHPAFDSGDHLHPGDAGYRAIADAIDLRLPLDAAPERSAS